MFYVLAGKGLENVWQQTLNALVLQINNTTELINNDPKIDYASRTQLLASLADSGHKIVSMHKKMMPDTDRLAVALDVLKRFADFAQTKHPKAATVLLELLEPFAEEIGRVYG